MKAVSDAEERLLIDLEPSVIPTWNLPSLTQ